MYQITFRVSKKSNPVQCEYRLRLIRIYKNNRNPLKSTENHLISKCGEVIKVLENYNTREGKSN